MEKQPVELSSFELGIMGAMAALKAGVENCEGFDKDAMNDALKEIISSMPKGSRPEVFELALLSPNATPEQLSRLAQR
ncbi:hypothetical protein TW86_13425 [Halomonas sp. S2151]|uniref:hypothetical protein n=1 Tax=Halomonas sp. S2151 TaxID=579478 RepID=UPI0005F9F677|nr:hypothetical protein [Halomonas sp. S2151]KJZ11108.1 hypothetical protein TW86_13425 [Halomonas sp. S2151]